ncbi:MAG: multiheme c-type cytochrome [Candidatus Brocadiales bacterium]
MKQWSLLAVLVCCMGLMLGATPGAALAEGPFAGDPNATIAADLPPTDLMYPGKMKPAWEEWVGLEMGGGPFRKLYKPIAMHMYIAPTKHYIRPDMSGFAELFTKFKPDQCEDCHLEVTPGWVHQWEDSAHGQPRHKAKWAEKTKAIEKKLGRAITKVGCAECHGSSHDRLQMPYLDNSCAHCHEKESKEFVAGKKNGRPSHYHSWISEVVPPWYIENYRRGEGAAMVGCDVCHPEMQRCDGCHMRHAFGSKTAKKPGTCGKCHMGYDHPDYESYIKSAMGVIYQDTGQEWNWELNLEDIVPGKDWQAPTCAYCHFYQSGGKWGHTENYNGIWRMGVYKPKQRNYQYKSSLANAPYGINIPPLNRIVDVDSPEMKKRRANWIELCSNCHGPRFAKLYLDNLDEYMLIGWQHTDASMAVLDDLYAAGAIVPTPENRDPWYLGDVIADILGPKKLGDTLYNAFKTTQGHFPIYGPILSTGDHYLVGPGRPHAIELGLQEQWFGDLLKGFKGTAHAQQDYSWWYGWAPMVQRQAKVQSLAVDLHRLKAIEKKLGIKAKGELPSDKKIYGHTPLYTSGKRK